MKKFAMFAVITTLGLVLCSPALAGARDHGRGHDGWSVRGSGHYRGYGRPVYYAPYVRPRPHASLFFQFGAPLYAPAPAYVYAPVPYVVAPPCHAPVWVPGHYAWDGGFRFWVAGSWFR